MKKKANWYFCAGCKTKDDLFQYFPRPDTTAVSILLCPECAKKRGLEKPPLVKGRLNSE